MPDKSGILSWRYLPHSGPYFPDPKVKINYETFIPSKCWHDTVAIAGTSVHVSSGFAFSGYISNPNTIEDQNLDQLNILYVDPTGPAATEPTATTIELHPGEIYTFQPFVQGGIWVNSNASGHKFTAVQVIPKSLLDVKPVPGSFPPKGPVATRNNPLGSIGRPIRSYLYQEYSDDDNLQAFVRAYNSMQQDIVDTFNNLSLPVYCRDPISGALLNWVGQGVYGMPRPSITSGDYTELGPYNTLQYDENYFVYNEWKRLFPDEDPTVSDDLYRRVLTWHYSKGMGKYFSVQWLKKRIMQFLIGVDGKNINIDNTYPVSVSFGVGCQVTIRFPLGLRTVTCSAQYNDDCFEYNAMMYDEVDSTYVAYPSLRPLIDYYTFKNAVFCGVLELPFQFEWNVVVG